MKNAIIVHGGPGKEEYYSDKYPSSSNFAWLPWLQKQLMMQDIKADTPEMPHAYRPVYEIWKTEFERFDVTPDTTLVGHSWGGGFLVRWLSENKDITVGKLVLVAPSIDASKKLDTGFFDFDIDPELAKRTQELILFTSDNDSKSTLQSAQILIGTIPGIRVVEFPGYGHFVPMHMGTNEFPELVEEILK